MIALGASQNSIGGPGAAYGNVIAFNDDDGVLVRDTASTGNLIRANGIHTNGGLGINLEATGTVGVITLNDNGDGDNGPNALQNFPTITQIATSAGNTLVSVRLLNAEPNTAYSLELFRSVALDASGNGEGEVYVGVASVTTNASGNASVTMTVTGTFLGQSYAATATKSATNSTSEFGPAVTHN